MFHSQNVPALFKKGTLKLVQNEDGDVRRVAEATLVIDPFSYELARELGDEIADHLYTSEGRIREELELIDLRTRVGLQHVSVRLDDAMEPFAIISPVSIKDVSAKLCEDKKTGKVWLAFSFALVFSLEEKAARNFVLDQFGRYLFWTFEVMQRGLPITSGAQEAFDQLASTVAEGGTLTSTFGGESAILTDEDGRSARERLRKH